MIAGAIVPPQRPRGVSRPVSQPTGPLAPAAGHGSMTTSEAGTLMVYFQRCVPLKHSRLGVQTSKLLNEIHSALAQRVPRATPAAEILVRFAPTLTEVKVVGSELAGLPVRLGPRRLRAGSSRTRSTPTDAAVDVELAAGILPRFAPTLTEVKVVGSQLAGLPVRLGPRRLRAESSRTRSTPTESSPTPVSERSSPTPASVQSSPTPASVQSSPTPASERSSPTPASERSSPTPASRRAPLQAVTRTFPHRHDVRGL